MRNRQRPTSVIRLGVLLALLFSFSIQQHASWAARGVDQVVAVVNEDPITFKDIQEYFMFLFVDEISTDEPEVINQKFKENRKDITEKLIDDRLLLQEARNKKVTVTDAEIERRLDEIKKDNGGEDAFMKGILARGLTVPMLKEKLREQIMIKVFIEETIRPRIEVSPSEVNEYYAAYPDQFTNDEERSYEALKFVNKLEAMYVYKLYSSGDSFDKLKETYKDNLVDGKIRKNEGADRVIKILFNLQAGMVSRPVKVGNAFLIFRVVDVRPKITVSFQEAQESIYGKLYSEKFALKIKELTTSLKQKAYIKIYEDTAS